MPQSEYSEAMSEQPQDEQFPEPLAYVEHDVQDTDPVEVPGA